MPKSASLLRASLLRIPLSAFRIPLHAALPAIMALGTAGLPARAAPCEPGFRAIHDFQVGDVFQFRDQGGAQFAAGNMLWEEFRKYRIVSKEGTPQERTYRILGLSRRSAAYPNGLKDTTYSPIDDSLRLVDSAGHSLNGCAGDTVPMPSPGYGFTRIEAAQGDTGWFALAEPTLRMKRLGYQEVRRPEDPIFDGPRPTRIYAEGLGLVRESIGYLSSPARFHILIGYVRDGRTVGVVFPDEQLLPVTPIRIQPAAGPAPRAGIAAGRPGSPFDLRGRRLAIPQARARAEGGPRRARRAAICSFPGMEFAPIEGKEIFITGGAGFIGSTLTGLLLDRGNKVTIYDNFSRDSISNKSFKGHANLTAVKGDILDPAALRAAMGNPHLVVHCAAIAGIDTVIKSPITTMRTNMLGSANVLEACAALGRLERAVFFSTSEVFGQNAFRSEESHSTITGAVGEARWTYAISKLAEEHLAHAYYKEKGLPVVTVRPFNVYGPGQVGEGAIKIFIEKALKDETIEIHGDGSQIRAWCYVDDLVRGIGLALTSPKAIGETFNLGNARAIVTVYGLANTIVRVLGSKSKIVFSPKEYADVELRIPSIKKSRALLGFEAEVDLEDGILRTAASYRR